LKRENEKRSNYADKEQDTKVKTGRVIKHATRHVRFAAKGKKGGWDEGQNTTIPQLGSLA
jgi:hypothetical protein